MTKLSIRPFFCCDDTFPTYRTLKKYFDRSIKIRSGTSTFWNFTIHWKELFCRIIHDMVLTWVQNSSNQELRGSSYQSFRMLGYAVTPKMFRNSLQSTIWTTALGRWKANTKDISVGTVQHDTEPGSAETTILDAIFTWIHQNITTKNS